MRTTTTWTRFHAYITVSLVAALAVTTSITVSSAQAQGVSFASPVGSFGVGDGLSGGVDERTGEFSTQISLLSLPGCGGGSVDVGISYTQSVVAGGVDRFGLGVGWGWDQSFVDVNGGVRVFPASGGVFNADASELSGLQKYVLGDVLFSQESGVLPPRLGLGVVDYAYSLAHIGGMTDYFSAVGDMVARVDVFGARVDWVWEPSHRLVGVVDGGGSRAQMVWGDAGVSVVGPQRSDGVSSITVLEVSGDRLVSVTNPVGERVGFGYQDGGLLDRVRSGSGAVTEVSYQQLPDAGTAVDRVRVIDSATGVELSVREWEVVGAGHTASGWPWYSTEGALWGSGDGQFRYQTQLSDGVTRVVSEYNSMGLMVGRTLLVSSAAGEVLVQEQRLEFPGTEQGGVPDPQTIPKQYQKPTKMTVVFRDDRGGMRQVSEQMVFDDAGRATKRVSADGQVTETVYDTEVPFGMVLPVGVALEQTITGSDGAVAKTVNTPTVDRKAVAVSETFVGASSNAVASTSRTEMVVDADGFVSEERVVATGESGGGPSVIVTRFDRSFTHDAGIIVLSQTDAADTPAASTVSMVVDTATGLTLSTIDATGRATKVTYDRAGRVLTETDLTGLQTVTEYGKNVTRVTDPAGITRTEYVDVLGQVTKVTDNLLGTSDGVVAVAGLERVRETRVYEQNSSKITVTDARGLETVTVSDIFGRPVEVTALNGLRQVWEYDDVANMVSTGLVAGSAGLVDAEQTSTTVKDDSDRVVKETATRADYEHDSGGMGLKVPESITRYDGLGRVTEQVSHDLSTSVILNPDGTPKITHLTPTKPEAFAGSTITAERDYNVAGIPTKKTLTQPDGHVRPGVSRVLDAAGRTISETDQAGNITTYEYTVDGLVAEIHNQGATVVTRNTYDPVTRALILTEVTGLDGDVSRTAFEYDQLTGELAAIYDPEDQKGTQVAYAYNIFGDVTQISYPDEKTITHSFDEWGRAISSTDIAGNVTTYEYDRFGFLTDVTQISPHDTVLGHVEYDYDLFGRMVKLSRGNDVNTVYTFTSADQIKTETTSHGGSIISDAVYEYDTHGNLIKRVDTHHNMPTTERETQPKLVTETSTYTYNAYDQLTTSSVYDGEEPIGEPRLHTEYEINISGDITKESVTIAGAKETGTPLTPISTGPIPPSEVNKTGTTGTTVREFEYNSRGHLTAVTTNGVKVQQEYDAAGNLTRSYEGSRYTYNVFNQPVAETRSDGMTVENTYWVTGQLRTTVIDHVRENVTLPLPPSTNTNTNTSTSTSTKEMYWDGATLVNDTHIMNHGDVGASTLTASYLIGASRHMRTVADNTVAPVSENITSESDTDYYITDRHGNTVALTENTGQVTTTYTYGDYGQTVSVIGMSETNHRNGSAHRNPFQYASEYTTETGTQYLGARTYDPTVMRFTTKDSAELHNLYGYANANPITMTDPTGQTPDWDIVTSGILAGVGVVMAIIGLALSFPTGGVSLNLANAGIAIVAGLVDLGTAVAQVVDTFAVDFISDEASEVLTWATFALGGTSIFSGIGTKTIRHRATEYHRLLDEIDAKYIRIWQESGIPNPPTRGYLKNSFLDESVQETHTREAFIDLKENMKTGVRADENVPADATNAPVTDPAQIKIFEAYQPLVFAFGYMTKKQVLPLKKTLEITLAKTMQQAAPELYTTEKYTMHVAFRNPRNEILHYENNFFGRMDEDSNPVWADSIISAF